jgi:cytochrome c-type biogenesis protein
MIDTSALRLGFAFSAGVATFFAPCAYPMLPGYVAFYLGDGESTDSRGRRLRQAGTVGGLASLGFFLVYAALAGVVAAIGTRALGNIAVLEAVVGVLLVGLGVAMVTGRLSPSALHVRLPERRRSKRGYLLFGIVYAVAAAGCTAPIFVAIAGVALGSGPVGAVLVFTAYAGGMALLMVAVTVLAALGRYHIIGRLTANTGRVARAAGVLLVVAGLAQLYLFLFRFGGLDLLGLR